MKKIVFLIPQIVCAGIEKSLYDLVRNLPENKYDITIIAFYSFDKSFEEKLKKYAQIRIIFKGKKQSFFGLFLRFMLNCLSPQLQWRLIVKRNYDIEVAYAHGMVTRIISGSKCKSIKYAWIHNDISDMQLTYFPVTENMMQKAYSKFDGVFAVSKAAAIAFEQRFHLQCNVQYNVIDTENIRNGFALEKWKRPEDFTIVATGRLEKIKGFDRLLSVHKKLISEGIFHHVYIIGEGTEHDSLQSYIKNEQIEQTAHLLGYQENPYPYIGNCDLFVCSSRAEGIGLVLCEAIVLGRPIVSTHVCGSDELFGCSEYGMVVENSEDGLYQGIKLMIADKELYNNYSKKAMERRNLFNVETIRKQIEEILDK